MTDQEDPLNVSGPVHNAGDSFTTDAAIMGRYSNEEAERHAFRKVAEQASMAGMRRLRRYLDDNEGEDHPDVFYVQGNKSGDRPVGFDVEAQTALEVAVDAERHRRNLQSREFVFIGEDVSHVARSMPPAGAVLIRSDSVDGSSQVRNTWMGAASVTSIETFFRTWARLEALSITSMTGLTLSLENHTQPVPSRDRDPSRAPLLGDPRGEVFLTDHLTQYRQKVATYGAARWPGSLAAVAYNRRRTSRLEPYIDAAWSVRDPANQTREFGRFANLAGNPIVFGLIFGEVEAVIETEPAALHDCVFLAAHQILGGKVARLDSLAPINFIEEYQVLAKSLDGKEKLFPPYVAYVGVNLPAWVARAHRADPNAVTTSGRHERQDM